jgi:hypothetical protein
MNDNAVAHNTEIRTAGNICRAVVLVCQRSMCLAYRKWGGREWLFHVDDVQNLVYDDPADINVTGADMSASVLGGRNAVNV